MNSTTNNFEMNSDPVLNNVASMPNGLTPSFQGPITSPSVRPQIVHRPELPPRPNLGLQPSYGLGNMGYNNYAGMTSYGIGGYGGMGGYGGVGGYGGMGGYGLGGIGYGGYNSYNRLVAPIHGDIESRFIQMAEEGSRPAFESIHGVVSAFGSVAMMMENTFFALTSSFRAILGVAENFGRLRTLFAQFWSTFAVIRSINWLIRKLMVLLGIRTEGEFKAWAQAVAATQAGTATDEQRTKGSSWPVMLFFGVIMAAPYIIYKMLRGLNKSLQEQLQDASTWQNPFRAIAQYSFKATSPQEINLAPNQVVYIAPQHLQGALWNSGWLMASVDRKNAGLIPVNYIRIIRPTDTKEQVTEVIDDGVKAVPDQEEMERMFNQAS